MQLPIFVDDAPQATGDVWVNVSFGTQGDQAPVARGVVDIINRLKAKGYTRFVLGFASMSGYAAEHIINENDEAALGITDMVLISAVNAQGYQSPSTVHAHFVTSNYDQVVNPSWALAPINSGWAGVSVNYGLDSHNQILYSKATLVAFRETQR